MKIYNILGMMSGTSLDGLDMAYCQLWKKENGVWDFKIIEAKTQPYSDSWKPKLKNAILLSDAAHSELDKTYGKWLGEQAKEFIQKNNLNIDFIASHGHTSHHRPEDSYTFQLGNGQELADYAGEKVICDFRSLDVKLGGHGAPLVPIGDEILFNKYDFCLNLGGISNISFQKDGVRLAYDIGLANMPLNYITQKINLEYDEGGKLATSGKLDKNLFDNLNKLKYYSLPFPKSTGYEWFTNEIIPLIEASKSNTEDLLHTFIHHNCYQIAQSIEANTLKKENTMLVCGGGALNNFFIKKLRENLNGIATLEIPSKELINFKEALVFALMGVLRTENKINVLSSVTGASKDSCSGVVFVPN
ncbi:anhydro-N-acetylmuramic acid kinase [Croceitalea sp. MTPC9]|uniref:anhydro-N-acetylmuramic acid kinase n=1 Tax=unclassified Croceitalea TaxID=2632280 RepID=UPI002B3F419A|nr:anhydro-N-acetylmuramic acid kinase [Croceitalea sp. MTPC6]GMN15270.1 anhydro-N-acetylmuramic acid kinase [Croceitalea sp. MTPC9]